MSFDLQIVEHECEFKNFDISSEVLSMESSISDGAYLRIFGPSFYASKGQQFQLSVGWKVKVNENNVTTPDPASLVGADLHMIPGLDGTVFKSSYLKLFIELLNVDSSKNDSKISKKFHRLDMNGVLGWRGVGAKMSEVVNPAMGWLHEGALRLKATLHIAEKDEAIAQKLPSDPQKELAKDLKALFSSGENTDVVIRVKGDEVHAHSAILMARSSVLAAMLRAPMKERRTKEVVIDDLEGSAVKATISFLYTGEVDAEIISSDEAALDILQVAHRYDVTSLVDVCLIVLLSRLNVQSVAKWFYIADLIGSSKFRLKCLDFIRLNISEVQATETYVQFIQKNAALVSDILATMFPPSKKQRTQTSGAL